MAKLLTRIFALLAVGCLTGAGYLAFRPIVPEPSLEVRSADQDLGKVSLGTHEVIFSVHNPGRKAHRIINTGASCTGACCVRPKQSEPIAIAPGETITIACEFKIAAPGPFQVEFPVFLDADGLRCATITVRGIGEAHAQPEK